MPNLLETRLRREYRRKVFRKCWTENAEYRQRKLEENRAYIREDPQRFRNIYIRQRGKLGLIPFFEVLKLVGVNRRLLQSCIKSGLIPAPIKFRAWRCYSVEQVSCLAHAKLFATIDREDYAYFSLEHFVSYVKENWPLWEDTRCRNKKLER